MSAGEMGPVKLKTFSGRKLLGLALTDAISLSNKRQVTNLTIFLKIAKKILQSGLADDHHEDLLAIGNQPLATYQHSRWAGLHGHSTRIITNA